MIDQAQNAENLLLSVQKIPEYYCSIYDYSGTKLSQFPNVFYLNNSHLFKANFQFDTLKESNSTIIRISDFPAKFLQKANSKILILRKQLDKQSKKYINKMLKQETHLKQQFFSLDSNTSQKVFSVDGQKEYSSLLERLKFDSVAINPRSISGEYYPYIDSLQTLLSYLDKNPQIVDANKLQPEKIKSALQNLLVLQSKMQDADQIKQFILQRKEQLKQYLSQFTKLPHGILNAYKNYDKQLFYYSEQVKKFRETLNDPEKLTKLALALLNKVPAFTSFVKKNSILASIFNINGTYSPSAAGQGLPTRDQVLASFQNQAATVAGPNVSGYVQRNIQSATGVVDQLRDKLKSSGSGGADLNMPNFHPNDQKTKSFLKRLQLGTDLQSLHANSYFPTSTDFGVSLGYKINTKNTIGIGGSIKIGWGKDINHIQVTGEGASIRSFADINVKKNFYATGGFEYNYQQPFNPLHFSEFQNWRQSGLIGISKKSLLNSKLLKSTKIQLLWDFLSYRQIPRSQPLKFRVGYNF